MRGPWTARRSNQSFLKEINPEYSLEGLILNWSWCKKTDLLEKLSQCWERLRAGEGGADDEMVGWHCRLKGCEFEQTPETVKDREAWGAACSPGGVEQRTK